MDLEAVLFLGVVLVAAIAVGSAFGFRAAFQVGALSRRLAMLEAQLAHERRGERVVEHDHPVAPPAAMHPPSTTPPAERPQDRALREDILRGEMRRDAVDWWRAFELRAGTRWITWLGAAALVIGAALFLKLAIDEGWLGPVARLGLAAAGGAALLAGGRVAHRAEMRPLSQGLFGAGLGVLYVVTFVALSSHGLITRELAFAAMVGITVGGGALALRHDAQAVAILALVGGLVTPVAVSSGDGGREALCSYLVVLDVGALVIAYVRGWRAVELVAVAGTWILFGGWLEGNHTSGSWRGELGWLAGFHVLFLAAPYVLRREADGRFLVATACAVIAFVMAAVIVEGDGARLGAIALVMAAGYALVAIAGRDVVHRGFVLVTVALVTLAVPLLLVGGAIAIAWAMEAPVLVLLGTRWRDIVLRSVGLGVLGLATCHVAGRYADREVAAPFANGEYATALVVALVAGAVWAVERRAMPADRWRAAVAALGGAAVALIATHVELASVSAHLRPLLWASGAGVAIVVGGRWGFAAAAGSAGIAGVLVLEAYGHETSELARLGTALVTLSVIAVLAHGLQRRGEVANARAAWIVTLSGLGCVIGAEAGAQHHALLSVAWAVYAAVLLAVGFVRRQRALRLGGLGLIGLVVAKLVLHDLAGAAPIHRVVSFLMVGALMIGASFAYHRLERRASR